MCLDSDQRRAYPDYYGERLRAWRAATATRYVAANVPRLFRLADVELDPAVRELRHGGVRIALPRVPSTAWCIWLNTATALSAAMN